MALFDVSKMITTRQRLCEIVESFVRVSIDTLTEALTEVFRIDLEEGQPVPDVLGLVNSLLKRLRRSLEALIEAEMQLVASVKEEGIFRTLRDEFTSTLRSAFFQARDLCNTALGPRKTKDAGFPRRIAEEPLALLRQVLLVTRKFTDPDFDPGESLLPDLSAPREAILGLIQPKAAKLRQTIDGLVRQGNETQARQTVKNRVMDEFDTTYALFVRILEASFRLGGEVELAKRFRRASIPTQRPNSSEVVDPGADEPSDDVAEGGAAQDDAAQGDGAKSDTAEGDTDTETGGVEAGDEPDADAITE